MLSYKNFFFVLGFFFFTSLHSQSTYKYGPNYKIAVPDYMKKVSSLNEEASMQYANLFREVYFIVINDNKKEFLDVLKEVGYYEEYVSPLKQFSGSMQELYRESGAFGEMNLLDRKMFFAGDSPGEMLFFESKLFDQDTGITYDIFYVLAFIAGEKDLYQVMAWTSVEKVDKYRKTLENIALSFIEL
tara:strand:+ start:531 stop:1091 length:561 start_codon:yes stop_codon:yes gene_type:complete